MMKVKQLVEKLEKLDQEGELMLFMRDRKRPHLGSGTLIPIKDIGVASGKCGFTTVSI
ncbi:hypothetical protein ACQVSR_27975 [Bacillus paranthracis]|uniref:hypothetical protein n=1 Tax=Bacillus paranthracis TaxID=2026186 RepID=UPI002FF3DE32|nr:hypothetical protein [Bacillus pacificus]HDR7970260.1 hypothetical protein [Bacillus pacificus]